MRQIRVDYPPRQDATAQRQGSAQASRNQAGRNPTPHCDRHPGVHMVLAGMHPAHNTVRYLCPLCNAMGLPPIEIATGVVTRYLVERGFGFIENGGQRPIFFHVSGLAGQFTPYAGMPVTCQVEENERGLIGLHVRPR